MMIARRVVGVAAAAAVVGSAGLLAAPAQAIPVSPVTITKEVLDGPLVAGSSSPVTFKITVTNTSQDTLSPDVLDLVPPGLVVKTYSSAKWKSCFSLPDGVRCASTAFAAGETATLLVTVTALPWVRAGTYTNCADTVLNNTIGGPVLGCNGKDNVRAVARADVQVVEDADLELSASHASQYDQVDPGKDAVVDFAVKNNGPSDATGPIRVKGTLPAGLDFVSGTAPWTCAAAGQDVSCEWMPPQVNPNVVTSMTSGGLARGATDRVTASAQVSPAEIPLPSLLPAGESAPPLSWTVKTAKPGVVPSYPVSATVSSESADSKPANNTASTPIGVTPVDIAVTKSASGSFTVDSKGVWKLSVSNVGTIDDAGVTTLVDTLPDGSTLASATGAGWNCTSAGFTVTCTHAGLAKGEVSDLTLTTDVKSGFPEVTNNATVTSTSYEKETGNNSTSAKVTVRRAAQSAAPLPSSPTRIKSGKTKQGQKLRTRVLCRPVKANAAGEVSFCKVRRSAGVVRVEVVGSLPIKVTVIQTAKGTDRYRPFVQRRTWIVRP